MTTREKAEQLAVSGSCSLPVNFGCESFIPWNQCPLHLNPCPINGKCDAVEKKAAAIKWLADNHAPRPAPTVVPEVGKWYIVKEAEERGPGRCIVLDNKQVLLEHPGWTGGHSGIVGKLPPSNSCWWYEYCFIFTEVPAPEMASGRIVTFKKDGKMRRNRAAEAKERMRRVLARLEV